MIDHPMKHRLQTPKSKLATLLIVLLAGLLALAACQAVRPLVASSQPEASAITPTPDANASLQEQIEDEIENLDENIIILEDVIILALFAATVVGIAAQWLRVPYTTGLVVIGVVLTIFQKVEVDTPNLILALLVPPLIFEAAFHLNLQELRRNLWPILILAVPGVLLTTLIVGIIVAEGTGMGLLAALVFGAMVSATDPVSVVALFRSMGVPKRLQVILEGESLFNDGTAIVIFHILVAIFLGKSGASWQDGAMEFIKVSGGGLIIGLVLGTIISQIIGRVDDYLIETTLTTVLAYGSYLLAESFHVSGVLAVVAAGLINGNIGPKGMSPTTRIVVFNFWEYAAFLANTFVFMLIGLRIHLTDLIAHWQMIFWGIAGILVARAVGIYGLAWVGHDIPVKWRHVLYWGGLRGAISLALALSLQELGQAGAQLQVMVFGVVLFTLLVQGFSMGKVVRSLGLAKVDERKLRYERRHARAVASRTAYEHINQMRHQGLISEHTWQTLDTPLQQHNKELTSMVRDVMTSQPDMQIDELDTVRSEYLRSLRSTFSSLVKDGVISHESYSALVSEVDAALTDQQSIWSELILQADTRRQQVNLLIAAVIQQQDIETACTALNQLHLPMTRLPSSGGFLGNQNVTVLIGLQKGQEESVHQVLVQSCSSRVAYLPMPIDSFPIPNPTAVTVGGATLFTFEVERFEEF